MRNISQADGKKLTLPSVFNNNLSPFQLQLDRQEDGRKLSDFINAQISVRRSQVPAKSLESAMTSQRQSRILRQSSSMLSAQDEERSLADFMKQRSPQIKEILRQRNLQTRFSTLNQASNKTLSVAANSQLSNRQALFKSLNEQQRQASKVLRRIRQNAHSEVDTNNDARGQEIRKQEPIFDVADRIESLDLNPILANHIVDQICKKVGVIPTQVLQSQLQNKIDESAVIDAIKKQKDFNSQNIVVMQPFSTLEDKEGVFRQAATQFKVLDTNLTALRKLKPDLNLEDRVSISGVKLTEQSDNEKRLQRIPISQSLNFKKQPVKFYKPRKSLNRSLLQKQVLENITKRIQDTQQPSKFISEDIISQIREFESKNCLEHKIAVPSFAEQMEDAVFAVAKAKRRARLLRTNPEIVQEEEEQQEKIRRMQQQLNLQKSMIKVLKKSFKAGINTKVLTKLEEFNQNKSDKFIKEQIKEISQLNMDPQLHANDQQNEQHINDQPLENQMKSKMTSKQLQQRRAQRKEENRKAYNKFVSESYVQNLQDLSADAADFYKEQAINLYMTEQFCTGDKYLKFKHQKLMKQSLAVVSKGQIRKRYLTEAEDMNVRASKLLEKFLKQSSDLDIDLEEEEHKDFLKHNK